MVEHYKLAHPSAIMILTKIFNIFLATGTVPVNFCLGITTPIPKYKGYKKNVSTDNFRGITVSPIASKIFEHCLMPFLSNLHTSERQYGFKKNMSCLNSIHMIRKVINYFNSQGNTVNLGMIDLKSAFDKCNIYGVLNMLQGKGVNPHILKIPCNWFSNQSMKVKWNEHLSSQRNLLSGVRQGGILSPLLFNLYVDCILDQLQSSDLGCFLGKKCVNSFMYADDLVVLSISVTDMQNLVSLCQESFNKLDLPINTKKSHCLRIGPRFKSRCCDIYINDQPLSWVDETKFLGVTLRSKTTFQCDWHDARCAFYRSANAILQNLGSNPPIDVALKLIKSQCIPVLIYGLSATSISNKELNSFMRAYNSIVCKLFGVIKTNDIKFVQYFSNYLEFDHLVNFHRFTFLCKLYNSGLISYTCAYDKPDLTDLHRIMSLYNLNTNDSKYMVKNKIWKVVTANIDNLM
jgi:hypothetical protein